MVDNAIVELKKKLNREPSNEELEGYLETHREDYESSKDMAEYDELKELLGREPTARELSDFLKDTYRY